MSKFFTSYGTSNTEILDRAKERMNMAHQAFMTSVHTAQENYNKVQTSDEGEARNQRKENFIDALMILYHHRFSDYLEGSQKPIETIKRNLETLFQEVQSPLKGDLSLINPIMDATNELFKRVKEQKANPQNDATGITPKA